MSNSSHRLTWAAIPAAILAVVPGLVVGAVVTYLYKLFLTGLIEGSLLGAIDVVKRLVLLWFPSLLHGAIAGGIALWATGKLFKRANLEIVCYATAAVWIVLVLAMGALGTARIGFQEDFVSLLAQLIGIVGGMFAVQTDMERTRQNKQLAEAYRLRASEDEAGEA